MKQKILICNRGEIALRIVKAIKELGHVSVGLKTSFEPDAVHLQFCDEIIAIEGKGNQETYLNGEKIISLCTEHHITALHPGYGFLSENAGFAQQIKKAGIIFIGPNPEAVLAMGDKAKSKAFAIKHNIPVVPGSKGPVLDIQTACQVAGEIGYPVLLKAVAGGGGRGMRLCNSDEEVVKNFDAVGREALSSFGNAELLVEKYILEPHHIEVQLLGTKKGQVFHFYERECSIQRRHQKVIEEAPSPFIGIDEELRKDICETAVRLGEAVGYDSAGTVEFVMGADKRFYFLEMNTRIQVEHPITEEITGHDLITLMIQVAFGEELPFTKQTEITRQGHAIEGRLCAEDPVEMIPSPGHLSDYYFFPPNFSRLDHCMRKDFRITPDFDPMIAKIIVCGANREIAIRKMKMALDELKIYGIKTNQLLLRKIVDSPVFLNGNTDTASLKSTDMRTQVQEVCENRSFIRQELIDSFLAFEGLAL